jgi:dihydroorotate dehydrogenase electron transfer subunit
MTAPFGRRLATVTDARDVGAYRLFECEDSGPDPQPGQFYMLAAAERWGGGADERPFLPRAFSYLSRQSPVASRQARLRFLLEEVGPGTARLGELGPGDGLWLLGPLGVGFQPPPDGRRPVLVGGGIGIVPLVCWSEGLSASATQGTVPPVALLGFRDSAHAQAAELLPGAAVATDDGSAGHSGLVTELLGAELSRGHRVTVYACGPPPMLEAVRAMCAERDVPAQLALESGMACGFGACFGCVVPTRDGYVRLCLDGPVLEAGELETALVPGAGH